MPRVLNTIQMFYAVAFTSGMLYQHVRPASKNTQAVQFEQADDCYAAISR